MALELNDRKVREAYQEFPGQIREQMPLLIADRRVPLSVAGLMERRLNSTQEAWKDNYFDTGDAVAYKADKFKVVLDAEPLRAITPKSPLNEGALVLAPSAYEALNGEEFSRKDLALDQDLTAAEAKRHPVWLAFARGDKALLNEYVNKMTAEMKQRFGYDTSMGIYLPSKSDKPNLRAWFVRRLEGGRSRADGDGYLGNGGDDRLVGVAPEALSAPGQTVIVPTLEESLAVVNRELGEKLQLGKR